MSGDNKRGERPHIYTNFQEQFFHSIIWIIPLDTTLNQNIGQWFCT